MTVSGAPQTTLPKFPVPRAGPLLLAHPPPMPSLEDRVGVPKSLPKRGAEQTSASLYPP